MNATLMVAALRSRYHILVGALLIGVVVRGAHALWGVGPWDGSRTDSGFRFAVMVLLVPAFAALLGADLSRPGAPDLLFELSRPLPRGALFRARLLTDVAVIAASVAIFFVLTPLAPSEALPLPLLAAFVGTWVAVHGLSAAAGAGGLRPLAASALGSAAVLVLVVVVFYGALAALWFAEAARIEILVHPGIFGHVPPEMHFGQGLLVWSSLVCAQGVALLTGARGWALARQAYEGLPRATARRTLVTGLLKAAAAATCAGVAIAIGVCLSLPGEGG